jgi:hypothetical protein
MQKFMMLALLLTVSAKNYAQTNTEKNIDIKDSTEIINELMDMLSTSDKSSSYFTAGIGIGNRLFSVHNNALNSKQSSVNTLIYSPSFGYYHKSGFNLSVGANALNDSAAGFGISQYSISPGYQLPDNKNVDFAFAYTHYFVQDQFSSYVSPIQNDFYSSFTYKKTWLQPGIALGYSTGKYKEEKRKGGLYDSTTNKLKSFSFIASVAHELNWYGLFNKNDGFTFTPTLMLNSGSGKIAIQHKSNAANLLYFLNKKGKLPKFKNTKFQAESIGLNMDARYVTGKFTIAPQAYFDYYLPANSTNRFTSVFTINFSYTL